MIEFGEMYENIYDCRLLIVEDEPELLKMVKDILLAEGYLRVFTAANCRRARQIFASEPPDCVILDVMLPDGNGFELMREFRAGSNAPCCFFLRAMRTKIAY
jgi:DNA-binding response OmpR family regulator